MAQDAEKLAAQAERLRELKDLARGVTFRNIADAVNVTERQVQRWFAGESEVNGTNLKALAKFLGTTPDYIEYGVVKRPRPDTVPDLMPELSRSDLAAQLDRIEALLTEIVSDNPESISSRLADLSARVDQVMLARAAEVVLDAEALRQSEASSAPIRKSRRQQR